MKRRAWSEVEIEAMRLFYPDTLTEAFARAFDRPIGAVYAMARRMGIQKSAAFQATQAVGRLGAKHGEATRYRKGEPAWNKGMKGWNKPGNQATQFKPGRRSHNQRAIGSERVSKHGYLQRKVTDTGHSKADWIEVHILVWTAANGPVPAGHVVAFRDGNKSHVDLDNLELVARADLMLRNSVHQYPPDLAAVMQMMGYLNRRINAKHR
ncbi:HNH endonuclease signature motif containing protein [Cupriavidus basilensis]|uniref:HNH endonuclease signature motif containing protein n=1 Tax=Cupriavidus basilensis TaxID=68895 RepID=A0ABT6AWT8_9BURK|nr:HNH endonuclease signature motif containing protein [Cupriavidus basilensis]MDF3837094.1 HNH endonuclease signature motif containing protein [Cupriavidus basilensis]